jgi:DNA-directed RNA polymerase subunit A'
MATQQKEKYNVSFHFMESAEIKKRSVALINNSAGVRFLDVSQAEGTLCDRRMGPVTQEEECLTCSLCYAECPGHFGHIELVLPVIPSFTLPYILREYKTIHKGKKITIVNNELVIHNKDDKNTIITAFDLLKEDYDKWDRYILQNMVVLSTNKRPYMPYKKGEYRADYLTQLYARILSTNTEKTYNELKRAINAFYELSSVKKGKNLHDRIDGKFGRVKSNIIGSRVNFTARAVVTCDPTLKLDEVGVPASFCERLTTPEFVFKDNMEAIKKQFKEFKYYQRSPLSKRQDLRYYKLNIDDLEEGNVLHRELRNGDWVVMNRQPSLHPNSMLAFKVKKKGGFVRTFSLCLSVCKGFNLDFDGDEMNMHVPQTMDAKIDCEEILDVKKNMLSYQNGNAITGLIYDAVLGIYELTRKKDIMLNERMVGDICCSLDVWGISGAKTARDMFQLLVPKQYVLPPFPWQNKDVNKIIKTLYLDFGNEEAAFFLNGIQIITNHWMTGRGFTTGMMDGYTKEKVIIDDDDDQMTTESEILIKLNNIRNKCTIPFDNDNNGLIKMVTAGSKGSAINYVQTAYLLGQQTLYGKRLIGGSSLLEKGFIYSNFFNGLTDREMFNLARCARANIADTAIQTPEAGYLAKQFYQLLENVVLQYDGTVRRNGKDILMLSYGKSPQYQSHEITPGGISYLFNKTSNKKKRLSDEQLLNKIESYAVKYPSVYQYLCNNFNTGFNYEFFDLLDKRINNELLESGTNIGVIVTQCISEPATQMSLDSFHFTGIDSMAILGFPRIKELVQCSEKEMFVTTDKKGIVPQLLVKDAFDVFCVNASSPSWEIRYLAAAGKLGISSPHPKYELRQKKYLTMEQMEKTILSLQKYITAHSNYLHEALTIRVTENVKEVLIEGISGILYKKGNDYVVSDANAYRQILRIDNKAYTNSVKLVKEVFGIGAAYEFLCKELAKVMPSIDKRHYELLASVMTYDGDLKSTKTLQLNEPSPFSRAAYQRSLNMFIQAAFNNETENNTSVSAKLAMGYLLSNNLFIVRHV